MPSSPIFSHLIGTVSLLICAFLVTYAFVLIGNSVRTDVTRPQLQEVADHIASDLLGLSALAKTTDEKNIILVKEIRFPQEIADYGYNVRLAKQGSAFFLTVATDSFSWLSAQTELTIKTNEANVSLSTGQLTGRFNGKIVTKTSVVHSATNTVIWCVKDDSGTSVGLGFYSNP